MNDDVKVQLLKEFEKLKNDMNCNICLNTFKNPVRIKTCGHYFCENCLDKSENVCSECNTSFDSTELDYNNIARETMEKLLEFYDYLKSSNDINPTEINPVSTIKEINTFDYEGTKYHINFLEHPNKVNAKGESALHVACKKNKIKDVEDLLRKTVDLNLQDFAGWAPIHEAIQSKSYEVVKILIKHGALINIPGVDYTTPLHKAINSGNEDIIRFLLERGANRDALDYFGRKPLEYMNNPKLLLAYENIKQIDNNVQELFFNKNVTAYCYYINEEYKTKLKQLNIKIVNECNFKKITHFFIKKSLRVSAKILLAMLECCIVVPQEWIDDYLNSSQFMPVLSYTFVQNEILNEGIRKALLNSMLKLPRLFDGIHFHVLHHSEPIRIDNFNLTKNDIIALIQSGNGKILNRPPSPGTCENSVNYPYHSNIRNRSRCCDYIIFDEKHPPLPQYNMMELQHKPTKWLVDCILNFTILP